MPVDRVLVDTNIWLYTFDVTEVEKQASSRQALREIAEKAQIVISTQVLFEVIANLTRKFSVSPARVSELLEVLMSYPTVVNSNRTMLAALSIMDSSSISFWDALIVSSAVEARCQVLLTEDLSHGQVIAGVEIRNPFLESVA